MPEDLVGHGQLLEHDHGPLVKALTIYTTIYRRYIRALRRDLVCHGQLLEHHHGALVTALRRYGVKALRRYGVKAIRIIKACPRTWSVMGSSLSTTTAPSLRR